MIKRDEIGDSRTICGSSNFTIYNGNAKLLQLKGMLIPLVLEGIIHSQASWEESRNLTANEASDRVRGDIP